MPKYKKRKVYYLVEVLILLLLRIIYANKNQKIYVYICIYDKFMITLHTDGTQTPPRVCIINVLIE